MLEMKLRDKVAGSLFGVQSRKTRDKADTWALHDRARTGFAFGVLAKETASVKKRRKLREERSGAPPAGGKKK